MAIPAITRVMARDTTNSRTLRPRAPLAGQLESRRDVRRKRIFPIAVNAGVKTLQLRRGPHKGLCDGSNTKPRPATEWGPGALTRQFSSFSFFFSSLYFLLPTSEKRFPSDALVNRSAGKP